MTTEINYQALREAAEKATPDEWVAFISTDTGTYAVHTPGDERCGDIIKWPGFDDQKNAENNARYVAAFNPKVALELLGEIKRLEDTNIDAMCRIAELETNLAALAAENAGLKKTLTTIANSEELHGDTVVCDFDTLVTAACSALNETPATDAFLAEVRAQGVEMAMEHMQSSGSLTFGDCYISLNEFADQLRKGGNQ